jgi:S-DNA-T family DNA segregation ATPase FtsK/SpoIIIE
MLMARKANPVKGNKVKGKAAAKGKKTPKKKGSNAGAQLSAAMSFARSEEGRKVFALGTILVSAFMVIAFISHFFTGYQDQSVLDAGGKSASNWLGSIGAWISQLFVSRGFGIMAILIPLYTALWGFALLEKKYYRTLIKLLKYVFFGVLWGSVFFAFISFILWESPSLLGGGFGWYLNELLFNAIGTIGVGLLVFAVLLMFLVINFNLDFPLSRLLGRIPKPGPVGGKEEAKAGQPENGNQEPENDENKEEEKAENEEGNEEKPADDFVLSVRPAEEGEKTVAQADPAKEEPAEKESSKEESQSEDGSIQLEVSTPAANKADNKVKGTDLELEVSLPTPDEIPEITVGTEVKSGDQPADGMEMQVEDSREKTDIPLDGDNIHEVEKEKFEKIIPEEAKEKLGEGEDLGDWEEYDPKLELSDYQHPTIDLLLSRDGAKSREVNRSELEENKNKIITTLQHYKIDITSIKATIGPTVTLYEIVPAPGVRISKIRNLEDDIALSLAAMGIRIIAPIPGQGTIGIEIPNSKPEIVGMRSVMATEKFRDTKAELPLVLGRTISNDVYIADLAKMPHLLIAGATGQGKSVGINGIISSILYKKHPAQVKFVLIDPKKVELSLYSNLENHFLAKLEDMDEPIITDTKLVIKVLNSLCKEMDDRYDMLKKAKVRNLREYNEKFINRRLNPRKGHKFMPYIVLIIDEFADLMMTAGKEIETPIARLAQLARAIGIHLILATQRPSVNVITGIIKANFPARISFRVTSKVDSRTILDTGGADQLIGRGDMLLSTGSDVVRIQNAFIDTPEVDDLVGFISEQRGYPQPFFLPEVPMDGEEPEAGEPDLSDRDSMFDDAARLVVAHQQGSTSLIQRRLKLGYNRAGRIIDQLEAAGIVGPFSGSKARDVLVNDEYALEQILNGLP